MRIGLFDSGVGGLTVLKKLIAKYPHNEYIYYGDTLNIPYGDKTKEELLALAIKNTKFLLNKEVDMIIIACGTVSSNCLKELKVKYSDIPILSIVEPTIEYLNKSNYQNIGVIATKATINSHMFKDNINKQVYEISTPKLVPLIENNNLTNIEDILKEYLNDYLNKLDAVVLGCTHYPVIREYLANILPSNITIIDMSDLIEVNNEGAQSVTIYFSKVNDTIINNTYRILENDSYEVLTSS